MRTHFGVFEDSRVIIFIKMPKGLLRKTFSTKVPMSFSIIGLLQNPISQGLHALTPVLNLIDTSLSLFHSFTATFLS